MPQTVFILGAGASAEIDLPLGDKLAEQIGSLLGIRYDDSGRLSGGDPQIAQALQGRAKQPQQLNAYVRAARRISDAMPLAASIDNFLDAHRGNECIELCGKLAIVRSILQAERSSRLYLDPRRPDIPLNLQGVRDAWFRLFWRVLCEACTVDGLGARAQTVSFIVFNYDRCLEHFLYHAAQAYYEVDGEAAATLVNAMKFYHPYGSVGALPWQRVAGGGAAVVGYGSDVDVAGLLSLAARIKTFTESAAESDIRPIRETVNAAVRIVFLGFAYHRQNLGLLWPQTVRREVGSERRYFGTAFGISDSDVNVLLGEITARTGIERDSGKLPQIKCAQLFQEYGQSLSLL